MKIELKTQQFTLTKVRIKRLTYSVNTPKSKMTKKSFVGYKVIPKF